MIFGWKNKKSKPPAVKPQAAPAINLETATSTELIDIACNNSSAELRVNAMGKLAVQQQFVSIIEQGKYPDTRLLAAQHLVDEDALRNAYTYAKQKDKNAARIIKDKIHQIDTARQLQQATEAEIKAVLTDLSELAKAAWTPQYKTRFVGLQSRWQKFGGSRSAEQQSQFDQASALVNAQLEANRPRLEAPKTQSEICELLAQIASACQQASLIEAQIACFEWGAILDAQSNRWRETALLQAPDDSLRQDYTSLSQSLLAAVQLAQALNEECRDAEDFSGQGLARLHTLLGGVDWRLSETPNWFGELATLIDEVKCNQQQAASAEAETRGEIHKLFAALRRAISSGRLLPAKSMSGKLEKLIHGANLGDTARYEEQLESLNIELSKLMDWNDFATAPKYQQLCEAMSAVAEEPLELERDAVDARVAAVKSLQDEWRELGRSDISEEYWVQFQAAGHKAYAPAQEYFELQRQQRAANLERRQQLYDQLAAALATATESQQWKLLEKTLLSVKRDWHKFRGVERKAGLEIKQRFEHLIQHVELELAPQYEAGIAAKQNLIDRMQSLLGQDIGHHVVHQAKELQAAWKVAGLTPRDQDQILWDQFNGLSRQLFEAERALRQQQRQQEDSYFDQAKEYIEAVKQLGADASSDAIEAIQQAFAALPISSERGFDKIRDAFDKACDTFERKRDVLAQASEQQAFGELQRRARLCSQLEQAATEAERETVLAQWDSAPLINKAWAQAIEQRKIQALAGFCGNAETSQQRRLLCVQLEIALERDSPETDKALRMEYQLSRLQNRDVLAAPLATTVRDLSIAWCIDPPAETVLAGELERRFQQLLALHRAD